MIRQCLSNKNENATMIKSKKILDLNKALTNTSRDYLPLPPTKNTKDKILFWSTKFRFTSPSPVRSSAKGSSLPCDKYGRRQVDPLPSNLAISLALHLAISLAPPSPALPPPLHDSFPRTRRHSSSLPRAMPWGWDSVARLQG